MTTYTYTGKIVGNSVDIDTAIKGQGIGDAAFTYDSKGNVYITSATMTQAQADSAIADAESGSLHANKQAKIREVKEKSANLLDQGVSSGSHGAVELSYTLAVDYNETYDVYIRDGLSLVNYPFALPTIDGGYTSFTSTADMKQLADDARDRLVEIYTNPTNGEGFLVASIMAASDQTALDAITDTRS